MNNSRRYAEILRQVFQRIASQQGHAKGLRVRSICDEVSGQFLIVATGWDRSAERVAWHDSIMVDVFIRDDKVVFIENDIEKMLEDLIEAGIAEADIVSIEELEDLERSAA
jgi:XisI protein